MTRRRIKADTDPWRKRAAVQAGRRAVTAALWWLRAKGYRLVVRNYKCPLGEIDMIARKGHLLVFVEVKYRPDKARSQAAVSTHQWQRIARAAQYFAAHHRAFQTHKWGFDMVACAPRQWPHHIADCWRMR